MIEEDEPFQLVIINGMSVDQLRAQLKGCQQYHGIPILPFECDVQIIPLCSRCVEPEIEDEP